MRSHRSSPGTSILLALILALGQVFVFVASTRAEGEWHDATIPRMPERAGHVAILDPARERVVIFGGYDAYDDYKSDTWALSIGGASSWVPITPLDQVPPGRYFHSGIYDAVRERLIIFGGYDGSNRNDVWALSLSGEPVWTRLFPSGTPPAPRWGHAAAYDPIGDRMIVIGGTGGSGDMNDVWALSLGGAPAWTLVVPSGVAPSPRAQHAVAYDASAQRIILFGGNDGSLRNDVSALSLSGAPEWSALSPTGTAPSGRRGHVAEYDPIGQRILVFGGYDGTYRADVHALSLSGGAAWTAIPPAGVIPEGRYASASILDSARNRLLVCAGDDGPNRRDDVWTLALDENPAWTDASPWPAARWGHAAAYDSRRGQFLIVGGDEALVSGINDVWALSLGAESAWSSIATQGGAPSGRRQHTAIYDPRRDRLIVFGGFDGALRNDTWALSLRAPFQWIPLAPTGSRPTARRGHVAVYDAARDRMLVFGGYDGGYLSDVWSLSLSGAPAWTKLAPNVAQPSPRYAACGIIDPVRDRLVIFGGDIGPARVNDSWALPLGFGSSWARIETVERPGVRAGHGGVYDPARNRFVIFGGYDGYSTFLNDAWALSFGGTPAWIDLAPAGVIPPGRYFHSAVHDPSGDRLVAFGGYRGDSRDDLWFLDWAPAPLPFAPDERAPSVASAAGAIDRLALRVVGSNPLPGVGNVSLELAVPEPGAVASLRVFDVSGRRIATLHEGWIEAGASRRDFGGDLHALPPGVYFLRLEAGGESTVARVVLVR